MTRWYLDTSAALKLVVAETETTALRSALVASTPTLASCWLLETELRRAAHRHPLLAQETVSALLDRVDVHAVPPSLFREAGLLPGEHLRSLDAIHLAAAIRLGVDAVLTYDVRMTDAARSLGLTTVAPS